MRAPAPTLSRSEMLQAVYARDAAYDGTFFFAVVSTGVFCFPSCRSRKPRPENVRFFFSPQEALAAGFRPCKRCRPDLPRGRRTEEAELLVKIATLIREQDGTIDVASLARRVSFSPHYLERLFRRLTGSSLHSYIMRYRAQRAVRLLWETDLPITDIAELTGFRSLSGFYDFFLRTVGSTPAAFRQKASPGRRAKLQGGPRV